MTITARRSASWSTWTNGPACWWAAAAWMSRSTHSRTAPSRNIWRDAIWRWADEPIHRRLRDLLPEGDRWALAARLGVEHLLYNVGDQHTVLDALYSLCPVTEPRNDCDWRGIQWGGDVAVELGLERIRADVEEPDGGPLLIARLIPRLRDVVEQGFLSPGRARRGRRCPGPLGRPALRRPLHAARLRRHPRRRLLDGQRQGGGCPADLISEEGLGTR